MQPSRGPRRFHQLVLEMFISVYAINQRVSEHMALGVGAGRPVTTEEGHLTGRVGHLLVVGNEGANASSPYVFAATNAATATAVVAAVDGTRLRVGRTPRFDRFDHSFVVRAAGLPGHML